MMSMTSLIFLHDTGDSVNVSALGNGDSNSPQEIGLAKDEIENDHATGNQHTMTTRGEKVSFDQIHIMHCKFQLCL